MVFLIVFIHEMGHAGVAHYFKWRIHKIELLPFGGVAEVENHGNWPIREEFFIIIAGPIQHIWLIGLSFLMVETSFWSSTDHQVFIWHNVTILIFNLLPIMPLDGGRLVQLWCTYCWPYQRALVISWWMSVSILFLLVLISGLFFPYHLNLWVVLGFLIIANYLEWKQRPYRFIRFLMARQHFSTPHTFCKKTIKVQGSLSVRDTVKLFRRGVVHRILIRHPFKESLQLEEKELLHALFQEKQLKTPIAELIRKI